jgi:hypothetical protein
MDAAFEILLPLEADIPFPFETRIVERDRIKYNMGYYNFSSHYELRKTPVPPHLISKLPEAYQKVNWCCIGVHGNGLDNYRFSLHEIGPKYYDDKLEQLLKTLLEVATKWVVVFEPYYDFSSVTLEGTVSTVIDKIRYSLVQNYGFIIYSRK